MMMASASRVGGNDANTQMLIHCDGADTSTVFTDVSQNGFSVTRSGNAQVDTGQSKFGGASLQLDGTTDYLTVGDDAALRPGTGDFTIDYWIRYAAVTKFHTPVGKGYTGSGEILFQTDGNANPKLTVYLSGSAIVVDATAASQETWYHYAIVRASGTLYIFRDGVQTASASNSTNLNTTSDFIIGAGGGASLGSNSVQGHMDEFRYSDTARWTSTFTPPTGPYS